MIFKFKLNLEKDKIHSIHKKQYYFFVCFRGEDTLPGLVNIAGAFGVYESKARVERLYIQGSIRGPIVVSVSVQNSLYNYNKIKKNLRLETSPAKLRHILLLGSWSWILFDG